MTTGCYGSKSQAIINIKLLLRWVQKQLQQYYVNIFDFIDCNIFKLEWCIAPWILINIIEQGLDHCILHENWAKTKYTRLITKPYSVSNEEDKVYEIDF